jgi:hypothetical protein
LKKNIAIEYRFAEQKPERLPELAADLVRLNVDLIVVSGAPAAAEVMQSSSSAEIMSGFGKWTKGEEEFPLHPSAKTPRERLFLELEIGVVSLAVDQLDGQLSTRVCGCNSLTVLVQTRSSRNCKLETLTAHTRKRGSGFAGEP